MRDLVERRQHARLDTEAAGVHLSLSVLLDIEIVDISLSGVMFSSEGELEVGQRVQLLTLLGGQRFGAWIDIRRAERESPLSPLSRRCRYGASFATIDEQSHRVLRQFLAATTQES